MSISRIPVAVALVPLSVMFVSAGVRGLDVSFRPPRILFLPGVGSCFVGGAQGEHAASVCGLVVVRVLRSVGGLVGVKSRSDGLSVGYVFQRSVGGLLGVKSRSDGLSAGYAYRVVSRVGKVAVTYLPRKSAHQSQGSWEIEPWLLVGVLFQVSHDQFFVFGAV